MCKRGFEYQIPFLKFLDGINLGHASAAPGAARGERRPRPASVSQSTDLAALPAAVANSLRTAFACFAEDPQNSSIDLRRIKGQKNVWRIRRGDYRILFLKENGSLTAFAANDRKDVY